MYYKPIASEEELNEYKQLRNNYFANYTLNWQNSRIHYNELTVRIIEWNIRNDPAIKTERGIRT